MIFADHNGSRSRLDAVTANNGVCFRDGAILKFQEHCYILISVIHICGNMNLGVVLKSSVRKRKAPNLGWLRP